MLYPLSYGGVARILPNRALFVRRARSDQSGI